jgi:hypothetical protein
MTQPIEITSFGYLHGPAPTAHITVDVRQHFRDPHWDTALRQLTARDQPLAQAVMATRNPRAGERLAVTVRSPRLALAVPRAAWALTGLWCSVCESCPLDTVSRGAPTGPDSPSPASGGA